MRTWSLTCVSPEPELLGAVAEQDRPRPRCAEFYGFLPPDERIHGASDGPAPIPAAALHPRGEKLPHHCSRMYRRATPVGGAGGGNRRRVAARGIQDQNRAPRRRSELIGAFS